VLVRLGHQVQEVSRALTQAAVRPLVTTRRPSRRLRDLAAVGLLCGLGAILLTGYATYRIWAQGARDEAAPAGAIVVLGAAQYNGRPSPVFEARLQHAVDLYQQGLAPYLIVTGGKQRGDRWTEAETARRYAIAHGVPASAILLEDRGRTTLESLTSVAAILREHGIPNAVFVSDPSHMLRVLRIADDMGIDALGSATRTSPVRELTTRAEATLHELGALAFYFVTGQASAPDPALAAGGNAPAATPSVAPGATDRPSGGSAP
jgi:uncharacterized SAM-binding protein YcdF (DUF218 family)